MPTIDTTSPAFKSVCAYVSSVPMNVHGRGRAWRSDPSGIALMVQQIIAMGDTYAASNAIGQAVGISGQSLRLFCRGLSPSADVWKELRTELTKIGVSWLRTKVDCGTLQKVYPADATVVIATPPTVDAPKAVPPANLAVTNSGTVVTATPPRAITQPSPMAAKPGAYATSSTRPAADAVPPATFAVVDKPVSKSGVNPPGESRFAIDPDSQDILITTVQRLRYGTVEHRSKMREVLLQLGTRRS
jgi:hypothetical protein